MPLLLSARLTEAVSLKIYTPCLAAGDWVICPRAPWSCVACRLPHKTRCWTKTRWFDQNYVLEAAHAPAAAATAHVRPSPEPKYAGGQGSHLQGELQAQALGPHGHVTN